MEKGLRKIIEKIIMPKFPEVSEFDVTYVNGVSSQIYNVFFTVSKKIPFERERELYNDSYKLFEMLGPVDERLKVYMIYDYDEDKYERVVRQF
jgi:hypothetical protein